jgi:chemotaxis methyl-accepting protein methylase
LAQLALELKSTTIELDGFDIDISQCPPKQWMPPNVSFAEWNAFENVPEELHGKYDVVHIRLFMINVKDNDASAVIRNVHKMLSE